MRTSKITGRQFIEDMRNDICELAITALMGEAPAYTFEGLQLVEAAFKRQFSGQTNNAMCLILGFYVGECVVKQIPGAEWQNIDQTVLFDLTVEVVAKDGHKLSFQPMKRFLGYMEDPENAPSAMMWTLDMYNKYTIDELMAMGTHIGDGWYRYDNSMAIRLKKVYVPTTPKEPKKKCVIIADKNGELQEQKMRSSHTPTNLVGMQ